MARRKGYGQFCPVARASEVIAERWTPLVVRELLHGSTRFSQLRRGLPLISPTMLSQRLKTLEDAGLLHRRPGAAPDAGWEYRLTDAGESLRPIIEQLGAWGQRWIQHEIRNEDLDPRFLMWAVHRHLDPDALPPGRVVLAFELRDGPIRLRRWWIMICDGEVDLCLRNPGHPVDLTIAGARHTVARLYLGELDPCAAVASNDLILSGSPALARSFFRWYDRARIRGASAAVVTAGSRA
jgi:DNA-binding HxlR family transcriptional regulator